VIDHGGNPEEFFKRSEKIVQDAFEVNPKTFEGLGSLASLCLLRAEYNAKMDRRIENQIRNGIDAADRSIAANPQIAETHATRGKLYLMRARLLSGSEKTKAAKDAETSFNQAIKVKASIAKKYSAELEEANRLIH
jgi:hypothetical protein